LTVVKGEVVSRVLDLRAVYGSSDMAGTRAHGYTGTWVTQKSRISNNKTSATKGETLLPIFLVGPKENTNAKTLSISRFIKPFHHLPDYI
jgi:hypothetical protein